MISQPDQSLTLRGPSSVVSARTASRPHVSSRSKRYNRSHAGGSSYVPQNEFPVFSHSGDVEILIRAGGKENRYLLHKHTLTRCSGFFEASTSQEWSKASLLPLPETSSKDLTRIGEESASSSGNEVARTRASSPAPRKRWRYELDQGAGGDDIPMLIQKEANTSSAESAQPNSLFGGGSTSANTSTTRKAGGHSHTHSTSSFFRSVANLSLAPTKVDQGPPLSQADADLFRDYDNLFRIFYNYSPVLDSINIADAYVQCKSLLTLADQYDALAVVGPRVDHHLLQFQSRLWKQIAKYPVSYLRLGYLSRSKVIFQEALIHVVGQWPAGNGASDSHFQILYWISSKTRLTSWKRMYLGSRAVSFASTSRTRVVSASRRVRRISTGLLYHYFGSGSRITHRRHPCLPPRRAGDTHLGKAAPHPALQP